LEVVRLEWILSDHLFAIFDPEVLSLEHGPDASADIVIWDSIGMSVIADAAGTHDLPRLLMDQV